MATEATPIEGLDRSILNLCNRINTATYELLVLIREFDERAGWLKWGMKSCAEVAARSLAMLLVGRTLILENPCADSCCRALPRTALRQWCIAQRCGSRFRKSFVESAP